MTGSDGNALLASVRWIEALLLGPLATSIAVVAVASVGLLMLAGRINLRRGATVIIGCFILFGAASIAQGLRGASAAVSGNATMENLPPPPPPEPLTVTPESPAPPSDPYAGAAIRR